MSRKDVFRDETTDKGGQTDALSLEKATALQLYCRALYWLLLILDRMRRNQLIRRRYINCRLALDKIGPPNSLRCEKNKRLFWRSCFSVKNMICTAEKHHLHFNVFSNTSNCIMGQFFS